MTSMLSSQGVVLATAMAAVSGTILLLAFRLQKSIQPPNYFSTSVNVISTDSQQLPRSCISSEGKRKEEKRKKKKVQFAQDVVDPIGNSEDYRRKLRKQQGILYNNATTSLKLKQNENENENEELCDSVLTKDKREHEKMPANRAALYSGMLRDRVLHRVAYSF